jgi:hypothetical protein
MFAFKAQLASAAAAVKGLGMVGAIEVDDLTVC